MSWICKRCEKDYKSEKNLRSHNCDEEVRYNRLKAKYNQKLSTFYNELLQARKTIKNTPDTIKQQVEIAQQDVHRLYQKQRIDIERANQDKDKQILAYSAKLDSCRQELVISESKLIEVQSEINQYKTLIQSQLETMRKKEAEAIQVIQTKHTLIHDLQKIQATLEDKICIQESEYKTLLSKYETDVQQAKHHFVEEVNKLKSSMELRSKQSEADLTASLTKLKSELAIKHLEEINQYKEQLKQQRVKHTEAVNELQQLNIKNVKAIQDSHVQEINKLHSKIREVKDGYEEKLQNITKNNEALNMQSSSQISHYYKQINDLETSIKKHKATERLHQDQIDRLTKEYEDKLSKVENSYQTQLQELEKLYQKQAHDQIIKIQNISEVKVEKILEERTGQYLTKLNEQAETIEKQKSQYESTIKILNTQLDKLSKESLHQLNKLQNQYEQSLSHARSVKDKLEEQQSINKTLLEKDKELRHNITLSQNSIQALQTENQELQTKIAQVRNQVDTVKARETMLITQIDSKEKQLITLQKTMDNLKVNIDEQYREKIKTLTEANQLEKNFMNSQCQQLKQSVESLQKTNKEQELNINILKTKHESELSKFKEILKEKGVNTDEKDKQLSQVQHQYNILSDQARTNIAYLQEQLDKINTEAKQKLEKYTTMETHYNTLVTKLKTETTQQLAELKDQHNLQINQLKIKVASSEASLKERQKQVEELQTELVKLSTQIKTIQYDSQQQHIQIEKKHKKLELEKEKIRNAPPKLLDPSLKEARDKLMTELRTMRNENNQLLSRVKELEFVKDTNTGLQTRVKELETLLVQKISS